MYTAAHGIIKQTVVQLLFSIARHNKNLYIKIPLRLITLLFDTPFS